MRIKFLNLAFMRDHFIHLNLVTIEFSPLLSPLIFRLSTFFMAFLAENWYMPQGKC